MSRKQTHQQSGQRLPVVPPGFGAPPSNLPESLREAGETALTAVRKWADPRERELRKRRRARRASFQLGTASGLTTAGAIGLAVLSAPVGAVVFLGGVAVALVTGAAYTTRRYLRLRGAPLPLAAYVPRKQPPLGSAARPAIARLVQAERAMHGLTAAIGRSHRLPQDEFTEMVETAASGAEALHALAVDIVQMERALLAVGSAAANALRGNVQFAVSRLEAGVAEYEQVVAAAGGVLAVPETLVVAHQFDTIVADLRHAADRLDGWAQALTEVADKPLNAGIFPGQQQWNDPTVRMERPPGLS
ncbi:phage shock envelope stress response protein PspM [Nocardia goodfellowii]|uniref:Uncharacterized protein n=1 Tax=Nocardia goodfellowii TaxID=882446 RepID=A0ABS4QF38_9NOCA|nr:hypothetical protein [Nocardia goodfellowii]MBP2190319.1 hypothetical protein [Nocardia goodfellowii]